MALQTRTRFVLVAGGVVGSFLLIFSESGQIEPSAAPSDATTGTPSRAAKRSAELDRELAAVNARSRVKDELIRDLIDEKTTLREVAGRVLAMNSECKGYMTGLRSRFEGLSDEELTARVVLDSVELFADATTERKQAALARLGNEYATAFGSNPYPYVERQVTAGPRSDVLRRPGTRAFWRAGRRWARAIEQSFEKFAGSGDARMAN